MSLPNQNSNLHGSSASHYVFTDVMVESLTAAAGQQITDGTSNTMMFGELAAGGHGQTTDIIAVLIGLLHEGDPADLPPALADAYGIATAGGGEMLGADCFIF